MSHIEHKRNKPNIIFIMADDMGYGDLGCYGATKIQTPNMDRLTREGMRFTDAHSSAAVCTPSRYSVITGRYCWRSRLKKWVLWGFEPPLIEPARLTVASMLKQQGYATAAIGKWHLGLEWKTKDGLIPLPDGWNVDYAAGVSGGPLELGFDTCFCITGSLDMAPYCFIEDDHTVGIPTVEKQPYNPQQRKGLMAPDWDDQIVDVRFTEKAVEFIDACVVRDPEQPFFLYLTPSAPHRPCIPPDFVQGASQAGARGDMVALVDWMVGQIDETLARHNLVDDTLIVVTSDNGARAVNYDGQDYGHKSNGNLRGQKADIWDGGHREPFIARWPAHISPGSTSDTLVCLSDWMATCADIAGFELPAGAAQDSYSILPALLGKTGGEPVRQALVHHSGDGLFSVRQGQWKLILGLGSGGFSEPKHIEPLPGGSAGQLYNMNADMGETGNLWANHPDIVETMAALLHTYQEQGYSRPGAQA
ncbi:MAG: arylsulfatase [Anaerolineae bacterium]|nr:arylsulfatase [Anaerolineae bacterium]